MSQHLQRGKINMKVMKGMQIKLGGATNIYIYNSSTLDHVPYSNVQRIYVSECEKPKIPRHNSFPLSSQHHCAWEKQHFLSYSWPNSSCKIEKTFKIQINQDCMTEN